MADAGIRDPQICPRGCRRASRHSGPEGASALLLPRRNPLSQIRHNKPGRNAPYHLSPASHELQRRSHGRCSPGLYRPPTGRRPRARKHCRRSLGPHRILALARPLRPAPQRLHHDPRRRLPAHAKSRRRQPPLPKPSSWVIGAWLRNRCKLRCFNDLNHSQRFHQLRARPTAARLAKRPRPIRPTQANPPRQGPHEPPACFRRSADRPVAKRQAATARTHSPSPAYPGASLRRAQGAKPSSAYAPQIPSRVGRSPAPQLDAIRSGTDPGTGPPGRSASSTPDPPQSTPRPAGSTAAPAPPSPATSESPTESPQSASHTAAATLSSSGTQDPPPPPQPQAPPPDR